MPEPTTLLLFALAAVVLIAVPGPNLIYIATRSMSDGRRAGLACALGVETGTFVHVAAAAVGLSALLASSALAFSVVKYAGAAYLIYLGIRVLLGGDDPEPEDRPGVPLSQAYRQGVLVQVLNPKVALFFLAFLPQFVDPALGSVALQVLVLGTLLAFLGLCIDALYAVAAGAAGAWLSGRPGLVRGRRLLTGGVYLALGAGAALSGDRRR